MQSNNSHNFKVLSHNNKQFFSPGIIVSPADGSGSLDPLLRHTKGKEKLLCIFNNNKLLVGDLLFMCRKYHKI